MVLFRSPDPGPVMLRAHYDIFRCDAVLWITEPLSRGPGSTWCDAVFGVMVGYDVLWGYVGLRRYETFWCDAVAWRRRQAGDHHSKSLCMILIFDKHFDVLYIICILLFCITYRFDLLYLYLFLYPLTSVMIVDYCTFRFTYSVLLPY